MPDHPYDGPAVGNNVLAKVLLRALRRALVVLSIPIVLAEFFRRETGAEYGLRLLSKLRLVYTMARNRRRVTTASHFLEHLLMATEILKVPKAVRGVVVECGSYKGGSATNLSLICKICDRQLHVFDSFMGLPEPDAGDKAHVLLGTRTIHTYEQKSWCGTLYEVKRNITRCGDISVCHFHPGYFDDTLPEFRESCILVFTDVDLTSSLQTCLRYLWPLLKPGCCLFTHEAQHMEISGAFFDPAWWMSQMNCAPPGLVGAGTGIGLFPDEGGYRSSVAYTVKAPGVDNFVECPQIGVTTDVSG